VAAGSRLATGPGAAGRARRTARLPSLLCGSAANEAEFWHHFALVIGLTIDESTLRSRLMYRDGNNGGKSDDELALAVGWNATYATEADKWGIVRVDATAPLTAVVDRIIALADAL
jgi:hypothetical protein